MPSRILRTIFVLMVMMFAGLLLAQYAPQFIPTKTASANPAVTPLMDLSSASASIQAFAQPSSAKPLNHANPLREEPLLLLLLGGLLLGVASSIRRLTQMRRRPNEVVARRT